MANRRYIDFPIASSVGDSDIILIWQSGANKQTTKATFLSGLPENLDELNDVAISGLTNGQILRYDSVTGKWENTDQGNLDLNDLNDVSIVSPSNGQVLVYNSSTSKWENSSGGYVPYTGAVTTVNLGSQTIQAGQFVKVGGTAAQFLKANGSVDSTVYGTGSVTSVALTMPTAFTVAGSPITTAGTLAVTGSGTVGQYIRGDGSLADFPESSGGGSSVSYYLNGSVAQGTIGGVAYKELNKVPVLGAGTDFTIAADGYIASFITDAGDPNLLEIPAGNWNFESYFSASSSGGTPTFYVELYKYNGTTFTLIASSSSAPEFIAFGTTLTPYFSSLAVPTTTLALTDRLAVRYYVTHSGRTITLHTENNHLCQIITTFTTGITALNGLTAQVQNFAVGTSGTDFAIASATATHTFNLPTASATNRGALSSADWTTFNGKQNALTNPVTGTGASGQVAYFTGTSAISSESNLFWDATNNRLGIGTDIPDALLEVRGPLLSNFVNIRSFDSASMAANVGGGISFGGKFTSSGTYTDFGFIRGLKDNATSGDFAGYLNFYTRINGGSFTESLRLTSSGNLILHSGTFSDNLAKLQVNGGATFSSFGRFGGWNIATSFGVNTGANTSIYMDEVDSLSAQLSCVNNANNAVRTLIIQQPGGQTTFKGNITVDKSSPTLQLNAPTGTAGEYRLSNSIGTTHWSMYSIIGGSNSQGNWGLYSLGKTGGAGAVIEVTPSGNVGIGSATPSAKLEIRGTKTTNEGQLYVIDSAAMAANTGGMITFGGRYNTAGEITQACQISALKENATSGNASYALGFYTYLNGDSDLTERMRILSNGNVLISSANIPDSTADAGNLYVYTTGSPAANAGAKIMLGGIYTGSTKYGYASISGRNESGTAGNVSGYMTFATHNNFAGHIERMRITSDGYIRLTTNSGGIQFNGDTAATNALDDYEEGTWSPNVGGNATYNASTYGRYTKIGNVVTCQFQIRITTLGTGSTFVLSGFPFTSANLPTVQSGHCSYYQNLAVNTIYLAFYVENNATTAQFVGKSTSGATVDNAIAIFGNDAIVFGQITYRTA